MSYGGYERPGYVGVDDRSSQKDPPQPQRKARQFSWVADAMKQGMSSDDVRAILGAQGLDPEDLQEQLAFIQESPMEDSQNSASSLFGEEDDEEEELLEQYRLMAQIEARSRVRQNLGCDVSDFMYEKRGKPPASDDEDKVSELRPPMHKPIPDPDQDYTIQLPPLLLYKSLGGPGKVQRIKSSACPAELQIGQKSKEDVAESTVFLEDDSDGMAMTEAPMKSGRGRNSSLKGPDTDEESSQPPARSNKDLANGSRSSLLNSLNDVDYGKIIDSLYLPDAIEVRCLGCRTTLYVHPLASLVLCPDCNTVSPVTASRSS